MKNPRARPVFGAAAAVVEVSQVLGCAATAAERLRVYGGVRGMLVRPSMAGGHRQHRGAGESGCGRRVQQWLLALRAISFYRTCGSGRRKKAVRDAVLFGVLSGF